MPEASCAKRVWRSIKVTLNPLSARLLAVQQPAMPPPMMIAEQGVARSVFCIFRYQGGRYGELTAAGLVLIEAVARGKLSISPRSISRLWPNPGTLLTLKPTVARPLLTIPAAVKVLNVACWPLRSAICWNRSSVHISGFLAGAKPSRNQAFTRVLPCRANNGWSLCFMAANISLASP